MKSTLKGRMEGWTYLGKFRRGWEDNVKMDLKKRIGGSRLDLYDLE
jgi:hypothetical protein